MESSPPALGLGSHRQQERSLMDKPSSPLVLPPDHSAPSPSPRRHKENAQNCPHWKTPHTGNELLNNIQNCIQDWSIEDKLFTITLDNAAANATMMDLLKHNLVDKKLIPAEGKLLHHRCAGHVINLIVKDGLKIVESVVENIHESVKYIRSSQSRKQMFKEIIAAEGITCKKKPGLDITTRWNSTLCDAENSSEVQSCF